MTTPAHGEKKFVDFRVEREKENQPITGNTGICGNPISGVAVGIVLVMIAILVALGIGNLPTK